MSNLVKAGVVTLGLTGVLFAGFLFYTWSHWCTRVGKAESFHNGNPIGDVTVYELSDGTFLFWIQEDSMVVRYVFYPSTGKIGVPNATQFIPIPPALKRPPLHLYSHDVPVPAVLSDSIKIEMDMNIVVTDDVLEFTTLDGRRIVGDLKSYKR
jgi:hypothetical protein